MRTRWSRPLVVLLPLVFAACTTAETTSPGEFDAALTDAIGLTEVPSGGLGIIVSSTAHNVAMDRDSKIVIKLDKQRIQALAARLNPKDVLPAETPTEREERDRASAMLEAARKVVADISGIDADIGRFRQGASKDPTTRESLEARLRVAAGKLRDVQKTAKDAALLELARRAKADGFPLTKNPQGAYADSRALTQWRAIQDELLPDGVILNFEAFGRYLQRSFEPVVDKAVESAKVAAATPTATLRVRALLARAGTERPLPIHCTNYDTIEQNSASDSKPAWIPSARDKELFAQRWKLVEQWAQFANDMKSGKPKLGEEAKNILTTLKDEANLLTQALNKVAAPDDAKKSLEPIVNYFKDLKGIPEADRGEILDGVAALTTLVAAVSKASSTISALEGSIDAKNASGFLDAVIAGSSDIQDLERAIANVIPSAQVLDKIRKARDLAQAAFVKVTDRPEIAIALSNEEGIVAAYDDAKQLLDARLPEFTKLIGTAKDSVQTVSDAQKLPDTNIRDVDPHVTARSLDAVTDSDFTLSGLNADRHDEVRLYVELLPAASASAAPGAGGVQSLATSEHFFAVERFGFYTTLDAHLVFVKRIHEPGGAVPPADFQAAPSASFTLHFKTREGKAGDDGAGAFFRRAYNLIDPGIGIGVTALNLENAGPQVGAGVHTSILNDLVQFGVGWDLNVPRDREYFYVGIGLFEALDLAGAGYKEAKTKLLKSN